LFEMAAAKNSASAGNLRRNFQSSPRPASRYCLVRSARIPMVLVKIQYASNNRYEFGMTTVCDMYNEPKHINSPKALSASDRRRYSDFKCAGTGATVPGGCPFSLRATLGTIWLMRRLSAFQREASGGKVSLRMYIAKALVLDAWGRKYFLQKSYMYLLLPTSRIQMFSWDIFRRLG
jgi:hypothetical protein